MAEGVETRGQQFRKWVAKHGDLCATTTVIAGAFCGIASIFIRSDYSLVFARVAMLAVVFAYFFYLAAAFAVPHSHAHRFRHVVYQSAAFIVLALSLRAFSLNEEAKKVGAWEAPMSAKSVGELAAVMILFILVEVAAFVAQDVDEARIQVVEVGEEVKKIEKTVQEVALDMKNTAEGLIALAHLDSSVMTEAIALTRLWSQRAPNLGEKSAGIAQRCWRILLQKYLQEEQHDFWPSGRVEGMRLEGIPRRVRPVGDDVRQEDVSYFATNVGFYVKFLAALVHDLQTSKAKDQKVCIAVVTNVLPAHWWNWPFEPDEWRAFTAIEELRKEMRNIAQGGAQVDRVIAVEPGRGSDPQKPNPLGLWSEHLLNEMLTDWQILADRSGPRPIEMVLCSADFETGNEEIGATAFKSFPEQLKKGARSDLSGARIYPMTIGQSTQKYQTTNHIWEPKPLRDAYQELQGTGKYWPLRVTPKVERTVDSHFDVMFIGIGPKDAGGELAGVWDTDEVEWGMCLMNSYDASVETMFLSVISDQGAQQQYEWWRRQLEDTVAWKKDVWPKAAKNDETSTGDDGTFGNGP